VIDAPLQDRLRAALTAAMKARDATATAALRSALSAIGNAEAVDGAVVSFSHSPTAGAASGLGATEVPRRLLTEHDVAAVVLAEVDERLAVATEYDMLGEAETASQLRAEAAVLAQLL
jgi:hypothetical protein